MTWEKVESVPRKLESKSVRISSTAGSRAAVFCQIIPTVSLSDIFAQCLCENLQFLVKVIVHIQGNV